MTNNVDVMHGHAVRSRILEAIADGNVTQLDLAFVIGITQSRVSRHIKKLVGDGQVSIVRRWSGSQPPVYAVCEKQIDPQPPITSAKLPPKSNRPAKLAPPKSDRPAKLAEQCKPKSEEKIKRHCLTCGSVFMAKTRFQRLCNDHRYGDGTQNFCL